MADILELLIAERDKIEQAIAALQGRKRRGRPPGPEKSPKVTPRRGRPKMSASERKAASERMKRLWAQRKKAAKKS